VPRVRDGLSMDPGLVSLIWNVSSVSLAAVILVIFEVWKDNRGSKASEPCIRIMLSSGVEITIDSSVVRNGTSIEVQIPDDADDVVKILLD
jgi:hypothetical protein